MGNCEKCGQSLLFNPNHQCTFDSIISNPQNIINVMVIGEKNNEKVKKLTQHFQQHFLREKVKYLNDSIFFYGSKYNVKVTYSEFVKLKNINKFGYDLIVSFENKKENNILIIKYFGKTHYIFQKTCQKEEIIRECSNNISSDNLEFTDYFREAISNFFSWDYNNNILTYSLINEYPIGPIERIKQNLICPIGGDFMIDPVSTPYGHIFDRKNIEEEIRRRGKCPLTGNDLKIEDLRPDLNLKNIILEFHNLSMSILSNKSN